MPKQASYTQSRNWCFTDFEMLDLDDLFNKNSDIIRYLCWGREVCPTTLKEHFQGWVQFRNKKRLGSVKNLFANTEGKQKTHFESCKGTPLQNDVYCKKGGDWTHLGKYKSQGCRSDLEQIARELMDPNTTLRDVMMDHPEKAIQYGRSMQFFKQKVQEEQAPDWRNVDVSLYYGLTGTGKTRDAMNTLYKNDTYKIQGHDIGTWWDGYEGQKMLVIDEYNNDVKITRLLQLLDGYKVRLPVKGSFVYANWTSVIVTTNLEIDEIHSLAKEQHRDALWRRINTITKYE